MTQHEQSQLIAEVTRKVIAALNGRSADRSGVARVKPPAGLCTADGKAHQTPPSPPQTPASATTKKPCDDPNACTDCSDCKTHRETNNAGPSIPVLNGIVTASQIAATRSKHIELGKGARLTPLAKDYLKEKKIRVGSALPNTDSGTNPGTGSANNVGRRSTGYIYWMEGQDQAVRQMLTGYRDQLRPVASSATGSELASVVQTIARQIEKGQAEGAVLFVRSGALAGCFANRKSSLKAIVGTSLHTVEVGVHQLQANVLIIEYPQAGTGLMGQMLTQFLSGARDGSDARSSARTSVLSPSSAVIARQLREVSA